MKTSQFLLLVCAAPGLLVPFASGCMFLEAPPLAPTPTPAPTPAGTVFNAEEGSSRGTALNKPADPVLPDAFRAALITSGDEIVLQSVDNLPAGAQAAAPPVPKPTAKPKPGATLRPRPTSQPAISTGAVTDPLTGERIFLGAPDTSNPVRLAGIIAPRAGQTGYGEAIQTMQNWTAGQNLDVDIDTKFPTNAAGQRLVHVFFKGRKGLDKNGKPLPNEGKTLSLNRLMVRSGYAIVDLYSPTSFDQKEWLYDETYARSRNAGLWPTGVFQTLQQRTPSRRIVTPNRGSRVTVVTGVVPGAAATTTTTQSTTTTSQTTTTTPAIGTPATGAANTAPATNAAAAGAPSTGG